MSTIELCAGCLRVNEKETAFLWCNTCEEPVCLPCSRAHRKFTLPHDVIDMKDVAIVNKALPMDCKNHAGQKLIFFCVSHNKVLCPAGLSESHTECGKINHIEKAAKGIKERSARHDVRERIHNQKYIIEQLKDEYNELFSVVKNEKEQQQNRITDLRLGIVDRLRRLEQNIETHYNKAIEKISSNTNQLKSLERITESNIQEIEYANPNASEVSFFHLVKRVDNSQVSNEVITDRLKNDISPMKLQFIPEKFMEHVDALFIAFGLDSEAMFPKFKPVEIQKGTDIVICNPFLDKSRTFYADESSEFHACCFIDENEVIILEDQPLDTECAVYSRSRRYNKINLRIISLKDGKSNSFEIGNKSDFKLKNAISMFDRNYALLVGRGRVHVIDLEFKKHARTIELKNKAEVQSVTCIESQILVLCEQRGMTNMSSFIYWIDYNGTNFKTLSLPGYVWDLDIIEGRVFCTFHSANHITYTKFSGVTKTTYTSLDLREKCQIAVGDSMIFLLEEDRQSIYTVCRKTKTRTTFRKNEIMYPTHINYYRQTNELAVICDKGKCLKIFRT